MAQAGTLQNRPRGGALDALRFFGALFVVVFHYASQAPQALVSFNPFFGRGYLATDFFLMLSGFVLSRAYGKGVLKGDISISHFFGKRIARVYPAHVIILIGTVAMLLAAQALGHFPNNPQRYRWSDLPEQFLLMQGLGLGGGVWNIPSWTISSLLVCYAFFPWLWRLMQKVDTATSALLLGAVILFGANELSIFFLHEQQPSLPFGAALGRAAPLFLCGLCIARFVELAGLDQKQARWLSAGAIGGFLVAQTFASDIFAVAATGVLIIACGASKITKPWPGAEWGAKVSFSLFLTHTIAGALWYTGIGPMLTKHLHPGVAGQWVIWSGGVVFALGLASAFHQFVDEPVQALIAPHVKRLTNRRPALRPEPVTNG